MLTVNRSIPGPGIVCLSPDCTGRQSDQYTNVPVPMQIRVQLMGGLKSRSPAGNRLELVEGASINDVLSQLGLEATQVQIVMHNNRPQPNRATPVRDGDELTVVPPVGGG